MRQVLSFDFVADYCPKVIMSHTAAILIISLFREKIGMGTPVISCNPEPSRESRLSGFVPVRYHQLKLTAVKGTNHVHTAAHRGREKPLAPGKQVQCIKIVDCGV